MGTRTNRVVLLCVLALLLGIHPAQAQVINATPKFTSADRTALTAVRTQQDAGGALCTPAQSSAISMIGPMNQGRVATAAQSQIPFVRALYNNFSAWTRNLGGDCAINLTGGDAYPGEGGGTNSATISTGGNCGTGSYACSIERINQGLDMTGHSFVLAVKVSDWTKFKTAQGIRLTVGSDAGSTFTNYAVLNWNDPTDTSVNNVFTVPNSEWILVPIPWSLGTFYGTWNLGGSGNSRNPDPTGFAAGVAAIQRIQVRIYDKSTDNTSDSSKAATLQLGMIGKRPNVANATANKYPTACLVVHLDDGAISQYTLGYPVIRDYGVKPCIHVVSEYVTSADGGNAEYMTTAMLNKFKAIGADIALHAHTATAHASAYPAMSIADAVADITAQQAWMRSKGWSDKYFAWPLGRFNAGLLTAFKATGILAARTTCGGQTGPAIGTWPPTDTMRLFGFSVQYNWTNAADVFPFLDRVATHKGCGHIVFHGFTAGTPAAGEYSIDDFEKVIKYALGAGISIVPIRDLYPEL